MGTDVFLNYDGKRKDDSSWEEGYIRASIGMINENYILRQIFPPEVWECSCNNFKYSIPLYEKAQRLKIQYLDAIEKGYELGTKEEAGVKHGDGIVNLFKNMGFGEMTVMGSPDVTSAKVWFRSVEEHIMLGISMDKLGKKPQVEISW